MRDRIVVAIANFILRFASKRYRDLIAGSILYGLKAAAKDVARDQQEEAPR